MRLTAGPGQSAALALALAWGCGAPAQLRYEEQLAQAPPPQRHVIHSERLQQLMRGMERLVNERLPRSMDVAAARAEQAAEIARVAEAVAVSADAIPGAADAEQRRRLDALALRLAEQARALADDAPDLDADAVGKRIAAMQHTCAECHALYRPPGATP